jgi:predicted GIY-YIG superfamily endonuclease
LSWWKKMPATQELALAGGTCVRLALVKQMLMFPDPRPLVERLGREFFRQAPECPGVYLMRDAADVVLYVGKAKNLRRRLNAYRVANPDRMARRHLRLLRAVTRIELQECPDEASALARESELLQALKPRFNRVGTWRGPSRFLVWRRVAEQLQLAVTEAPTPDWQAFGPLGSGASLLRAVLVRLLWFAIYPERGAVGMPLGWAHGRLDPCAVLPSGARVNEASDCLQALFSGRAEVFSAWVRAKMPPDLHPFQLTAVEEDLEFLSEFHVSLHTPTE